MSLGVLPCQWHQGAHLFPPFWQSTSALLESATPLPPPSPSCSIVVMLSRKFDKLLNIIYLLALLIPSQSETNASRLELAFRRRPVMISIYSPTCAVGRDLQSFLENSQRFPHK